jgi:hypothetical protein
VVVSNQNIKWKCQRDWEMIVIFREEVDKMTGVLPVATQTHSYRTADVKRESLLRAYEDQYSVL